MNKGGPIVIVIKLYSVVFERLHTTKEGHTSDTIPKYAFLFFEDMSCPQKRNRTSASLSPSSIKEPEKKTPFTPKSHQTSRIFSRSPLLVLWNAMNEGWPSICQNIKTSISRPCLGSQLHLLITSVDPSWEGDHPRLTGQ